MHQIDHKLVLHVGLPKTATSALQRWAHNNRIWLRERGIDYPEAVLSDTDPRHQALVPALLGAGMGPVQALAKSDKAPTLFLSTEGLTNHFDDFLPQSLTDFRDLFADRLTTIILVKRNKEKWLRSLYWQFVVNPPVSGMPYATCLELEEFTALERIQRLLKMPERTSELRQAYGAAEVAIVDFDQNWAAAVLAQLGLVEQGEVPPFEWVNESIDQNALDFVLAVNRAGLDERLRSSLLWLLSQVLGSNHIALTGYSFDKEHVSNCQSAVLRLSRSLEWASADLADLILEKLQSI